MTDPGERIDLPNGTSLFYVDENHSYWRCKENGQRGTRLTGVTTAIKPIDFDSERLIQWSAKTQCIGIAELAAPVLLGEGQPVNGELDWLTSQESIWRELESNSLTFEDIRQRAADRGTIVHEQALRALASGRPIPDFEGMTDEEKGYARAIVTFWLDHEPEPLQVEQIVCDEEAGVAGRPDLRAFLSQCDDESCACRRFEGPGVLDLKTSTWTGEKDHVQIAAYRHLLEVSGFGPSNWGAILKISEEGGYELIEAEAEAEDFLAAVDLYRRRAAIRRKAGARYRERAAA